MIEWEEVKDMSTLARVKWVEEMIPMPAENQMKKSDPKIWEEQYRIIEECLRMDGTVEEACILAGISVPSYYNHRRTNPDFMRRMDIARQYPKMVARAAIQRRIRQWDSKTAMEFIKLRDRRYRPDAQESESDEVWEEKRPVVQFISVSSNEWADQKGNDSQSDTKQSSVSEWSSDISENAIEWWYESEMPWENDEQVLRRLDS